MASQARTLGTGHLLERVERLLGYLMEKGVDSWRRIGLMKGRCSVMEREWATETLINWTRSNHGNCYFTPVFCESLVLYPVEPDHLQGRIPPSSRGGESSI
ncbi:hypothetical protein EVAR_13170_1 [Eumeta japonica]|uniref:Uncharacterized protein n=1 Tax=Eumeta variegata TaxID=151549 RepID=A0A4C1UA12_EUMVA|nr:hypothetical protein EVAR_13170_1 [Eumeta japonica]